MVGMVIPVAAAGASEAGGAGATTEQLRAESMRIAFADAQYVGRMLDDVVENRELGALEQASIVSANVAYEVAVDKADAHSSADNEEAVKAAYEREDCGRNISQNGHV